MKKKELKLALAALNEVSVANEVIEAGHKVIMDQQKELEKKDVIIEYLEGKNEQK